MKRSKLHKEIYGTAQLICHKLNVNLFKTVIRNSKTLAEAQSIQTDITEYSPKSSGVKDFNSLVTELEELNII
jgi:chromosome partitioning protein